MWAATKSVDGVGLEKAAKAFASRAAPTGFASSANHVHDLPNEVGIYVGAVTTDTSRIVFRQPGLPRMSGIGVASEGGAFVSDIRVYNNVVCDCPLRRHYRTELAG